MKILFLTQKRKDLVCLDMFHKLEQEMSRHAECKWAGPLHPLHRNEALEKTVKRLYGSSFPDWVITSPYIGREGGEWLKKGLPRNRSYKVATMTTDIHECHYLKIGPEKFVEELNAKGFDALLMLYTQVPVERVLINRNPLFDRWIRFERLAFKHGIKIFTKLRLHVMRSLSPAYEMKIEPVMKDLYLEKTEAEVFHLVPWVTPSMFKPTEGSKLYDVILLGSVHRIQYPIRHSVRKQLPILAREKGWRYIIQRGPPGFSASRKMGDYVDTEYYAGETYVKTMGLSKVSIFDSSIYKYPLVRYWETMACKCLAMADMPLTGSEVKLSPNHNFVEISEDDWPDKLDYYITHDDERNKIIENGYETVMKNHTTEIRARQLLDFLEANR